MLKPVPQPYEFRTKPFPGEKQKEFLHGTQRIRSLVVQCSQGVSCVFEGEQMISGAHVIVFSKDAEADRAFLRDVLGLKSVDAGHGWLIFKLPPAEAAVHPGEENNVHELYFMCDDLKSEMASLATKHVKCSEVHEVPWGSITKLRLPGGGQVHLYQPNHPTALGLESK